MKNLDTIDVQINILLINLNFYQDKYKTNISNVFKLK